MGRVGVVVYEDDAGLQPDRQIHVVLIQGQMWCAM